MPAVIALFNVGMRGGTLAAKFGLLLILAFYLPPEEVGEYGLFAAALAWLMYLAGADFYTFSTREMIGAGRREVYTFVVNQIRFHLITYIPIAVIVSGIFYYGSMRKYYFLPFTILLVVEHLGLEIGRMLISLGRPILSSAVLFIRGGAWCLVAAGLFALVPATRSLDTVILLWVAGSVTALCIGAAALIVMIKHDEKAFFDWGWIWGGVKIALPLMIGSLAVRGIFTVDRIWIERIAGAEVLGAYVFYIGIATAIISFIDAAVVDFSYPRLVLLVKQGDHKEYCKEMTKFGLKIATLTLIMSLGAFLFILCCIQYLQRPIYKEEAYLVPWIVLSMAIYGLSTIPHVALYAHHRDAIIIGSQIAGLCAFLAICVLTPPVFGVLYLVYSLNVAFLLIFIIKAVWVVKLGLYK